MLTIDLQTQVGLLYCAMFAMITINVRRNVRPLRKRGALLEIGANPVADAVVGCCEVELPLCDFFAVAVDVKL